MFNNSEFQTAGFRNFPECTKFGLVGRGIFKTSKNEHFLVFNLR